jgi:hypothetical protein
MSNLSYRTPLILKLAKKLGIDLNSVTGSGLNGKIRKVDLVSPGKTNVSAVQSHTNTNVYLSPKNHFELIVTKYFVINNSSSAEIGLLFLLESSLILGTMLFHSLGDLELGAFAA